MQLTTYSDNLPAINFDLLAEALDNCQAPSPSAPRVEVRPGSVPDAQLQATARAFLNRFSQDQALIDSGLRTRAVLRARFLFAESISGHATVYERRGDLQMAAVLYHLAKRVADQVNVPLAVSKWKLDLAVQALVHDASQFAPMVPTDESTRFLKAKQVEIMVDEEAEFLHLEKLHYYA